MHQLNFWWHLKILSVFLAHERHEVIKMITSHGSRIRNFLGQVAFRKLYVGFMSFRKSDT